MERFRLPLKNTPHVTNANALRLDWNTIIGKESGETETTLFVLGNPPFVGKDKRSAEQSADMDLACAEVANYRTLDYVAAWYIKAAQFIRGSRIKVAFVSTNSITQGEQVGVLWSYLLECGIKIHFAHRTFRWNNEAPGMAAVHCVIIGFASFDTSPKHLFDYQTPTSEPHEIEATNINPYLVDYVDIVLRSRNVPLSNVPEIKYGSKPTDEGHLLLTDEERADLLAKEPEAEKFILPFVSAHEFINGENRWAYGLLIPAQMSGANFPK